MAALAIARARVPAFGACRSLQAQGRGGGEWTTSGSDAQRSGSIRTDPRISVETMQKPGAFGPFKFLWKMKLEHEPNAPAALTQPILLDRLIGFRGFKSIAFVATASETVHAVDIDFGAAALEIPHQLLGEPAAGAGHIGRVSRRLDGGAVASDGHRAVGARRRRLAAADAAAARAAASGEPGKGR